MAVYTTRIEADRADAPVLLANGNLREQGDLPGGRHFAVWHDPWPKPAYLFALVGGKLGHIEDTFVTTSGRKVALRIYVEPGKEARAAYAMDSLKRSMRWDEEAFGREYDLDIFMIVAVSDFNMGAMENKGLNVFNDKYVLASPETATDGDFVAIEAIIAHEYFHNWTGNRITCRDWFQLCLKEGLTVFRDQEFTSDERSRVVTRIGDVRGLRAHQFVEDAGPLAHPVRPEVYSEINNFYTTTVYEKGAEVVRMLQTLLGAEQFRKGMDLYFERHDGEAATVEQFVQCFADVSGRDLTQFMRWYSQAGTPEVIATGHYDAAAKTYRLDIAQMLPPTPDQPIKEPMVIPLAIGLLGRDGRDLPLKLADGQSVERGVLVLDQAAQSFTFTDVAERPALSINRSFSAPVKLIANLTPDDLRLMAARDSDPFNRWQAVQTLATRLLVGNVARLRAGQDPELDEGLLDALAAILADGSLEPAFVAEALAPPSEADIAREIGRDVDPDAIFRARAALRTLIGLHLNAALTKTYESLVDRKPYSPDAASAGRRLLKNVCLDLLAATQESHAIRLAAHAIPSGRQHDRPDGGARDAVAARRAGAAGRARRFLRALQRRSADHRQMVRAAGDDARPEDARPRQGAHRASGVLDDQSEPRALADRLVRGRATRRSSTGRTARATSSSPTRSWRSIRPIRRWPSRMSTAFRSWRALEAGRRERAQAALKRIAAAPQLSRDVGDIVQRALAES